MHQALRTWIPPCAVACGLALAAACGASSAAETRFLRLVPRASNADGVFLNEDTLLYFTDDVDRTSVTSTSVRILAPDGTPARGTLSVEGQRLRFQPAPVLAPDLSDGGYLPGTRYVVEVAGFPRLDGVRSVDGAPLETTVRFAFRTVDVTTPRSGLIFDDREPDRTRPLRLFPSAVLGGAAGHEVGSLESLYLRSEKPLDPSTIDPLGFELVAQSGGRRITLRTRLIENWSDARPRPRPARAHSAAPPEAWLRDPRAALLELTPLERLPAGTYELVRRQDEPRWRVELRLDAGWPLPRVLAWPDAATSPLRPSDFSGHPVWHPSIVPKVRVRDRGDEGGRGSFVERFLDTRLRSPLPVPEVDGTAAWTDTGRVEVRYPAAAGSGSDGAVVLGGDEPRRSLHATRLHSSKGTTTTLAPGPGLVVLRSQGRIELDGELVRRTGSTREQVDAHPTLDGKGVERRTETLSAWLARQEATDATFTVIVAGGDLVVGPEASIEVDAPLLLVAGGVVRVTGSVRGIAGAVWILGEGGGLGISPPASAATRLDIDPPRGANPLREPLRFAVLSGPLPQRGEVASWLSAEAWGSTAVQGRWRVRYVRPVQGVPRTFAELEPADSPRLLEPSGPIQVLVELEVAPGPGAWITPFVDELRLTWDQDGSRR